MVNLNIKKLVILVSMAAALSACKPEASKTEKEANTGANATAEQAKKSDTKSTGNTEDKSTSKTESTNSAEETIADIDKMGYALGAKMATYIRTDIEKNEELKISKDSVNRGFTDELLNKTLLSEQEIKEEFKAFQVKMQELHKKKAALEKAKQAEKDKVLIAEADAFLATNAKKEGVITTNSGLQYKIITAADAKAAKPKDTDKAKVHYTGSLTDGTVFDSSVGQKPRTFPLKRVISGWTEGLQLMGVGSKFEFVIPWKLAYGSNGKPGTIPRHAVLKFEVELLEINPVAEKRVNPHK